MYIVNNKLRVNLSISSFISLTTGHVEASSGARGRKSFIKKHRARYDTPVRLVLRMRDSPRGDHAM